MNITNYLSFDLGFFKTGLGIGLLVLMVLLIIGIVVLLVTGGSKGEEDKEEITPAPEANNAVSPQVNVPTATEQMQKAAEQKVDNVIQNAVQNNKENVFANNSNEINNVAAQAKEYEAIKEAKVSAVEPEVQNNQAPVEVVNNEPIKMPEEPLKSSAPARLVVNSTGPLPNMPNVNTFNSLEKESTPETIKPFKAEPVSDPNEALEPVKEEKTAYGGLNPSAGLKINENKTNVPYGGVDPLEDTQKLYPKEKLSEVQNNEPGIEMPTITPIGNMNFQREDSKIEMPSPEPISLTTENSEPLKMPNLNNNESFIKPLDDMAVPNVNLDDAPKPVEMPEPMISLEPKLNSSAPREDVNRVGAMPSFNPEPKIEAVDPLASFGNAASSNQNSAKVPSLVDNQNIENNNINKNVNTDIYNSTIETL